MIRNMIGYHFYQQMRSKTMSEKKYVLMELPINEWLELELADLLIPITTESELERRIQKLYHTINMPGRAMSMEIFKAIILGGE